jgi:Protein of unknown function (DUF938)
MHTGPGNVAFDEDLRAYNPSWGVRDLDVITALTVGNGVSDALPPLGRVADRAKPARQLLYARFPEGLARMQAIWPPSRDAGSVLLGSGDGCAMASATSLARQLWNATTPFGRMGM